MPTRHSRFRRWLVILLIALFAPALPGKMNLCLLPDGELHLESDCATSCGLAAPAQAAEPRQTDGFFRLQAGGGDCLDFTVGESAVRHQILTASQVPAPSLLVLPFVFELFPARPFLVLAPSTPSPHLQSQQTTVLRI